MEKKEIYKMKLHETLTVYTEIDSNNVQDAQRYFITRVAGGWIYQNNMSGVPAATSVFVPFDNEFMNQTK